MIAVIAGTGVVRPSEPPAYAPVNTPYGDAFLAEGRFGSHTVLLLARHGPGLNIPPHLINYRANIQALKQSGVRFVISTAAVGALRIGYPPGSFAVVADFIDFTRQRPFTFFDQPERAVTHTDMSVPYCPMVGAALNDSARRIGVEDLPEVTYACMEGPRYETPAEVRMLASLGADVVGMTGVPEVVLAREAGLCYGTLAIVTNFAAGISPAPLSHCEVVKGVADQGEKLRDIIGLAAGMLEQDGDCPNCRTETHPA